MNSENTTYEVIKSYELYNAKADMTVHGKILKLVSKGEMNYQYEWKISHYCRPTESAGVYIPSSPFGSTIQEVEGHFFAYFNSFSGIGVQKNEYF